MPEAARGLKGPAAARAEAAQMLDAFEEVSYAVEDLITATRTESNFSTRRAGDPKRGPPALSFRQRLGNDSDARLRGCPPVTRDRARCDEGETEQAARD